MPPLTETETTEFQSILTEIKGGWAEIKTLPASFRALQDENAKLTQQLTDFRRSSLLRSTPYAPHPRPGQRRLRPGSRLDLHPPLRPQR